MTGGFLTLRELFQTGGDFFLLGAATFHCSLAVFLSLAPTFSFLAATLPDTPAMRQLLPDRRRLFIDWMVTFPANLLNLTLTQPVPYFGSFHH